jgi:hypothetical protein
MDLVPADSMLQHKGNLSIKTHLEIRLHSSSRSKPMPPSIELKLCVLRPLAAALSLTLSAGMLWLLWCRSLSVAICPPWLFSPTLQGSAVKKATTGAQTEGSD